MDEVVIGEAVALDLRPAQMASRGVAFGIDASIMLAILLGLVVGVTFLGDGFDEALGAAVGIVIVVAVFVGYPLTWETLTRGRSPGKYAMGLRVVRDDGGPVLFRQSLARALSGLFVDFGVASLFTGTIGMVSSVVSTRGKRVGDLLAGTIVLRERVPRATASTPVPPVPPALASWAAGAEMSTIGDDLALAARQFVARAPSMEPRRRDELAERIATEVAACVAPAPPAGVPAELYLAAVLGERRRRETDRLARGAM